MVLTEKWGPRVRFGTVLTSAHIPSDPIMEKSVCIKCNSCVHACPVNALSEDDYPDSLTDKKACTERSALLNSESRSPCGICIRVCPVGSDRVLFERTDIRIYDDPEAGKKYHFAWDHVRSYGSDWQKNKDKT